MALRTCALFLHVDPCSPLVAAKPSNAQPSSIISSNSSVGSGPAFSARRLLWESQDELRPMLLRTRAVTSDYASVSGRRRSNNSVWLDESESVSEDISEVEEEDGKVLYVDEEVGIPPSSNSELEIANLGVAPEIVRCLADRGITSLFPIQRAVFEPCMKGQDLIARAKTGTGKTLAFGIPIMDRIYRDRNKLARRVSRRPAALVLAPTRELAKQVEKEFMESGRDLATVCVYGGVSIMSQKRALASGVDIAVGTPGRIIDLMEQGSLNLSEVQYMVLDEADQMLAVGFEEDVERIMEQLPAKRQNMLFSATMPSWVQKLSRKFLRNAVTIDLVGDQDEKLAEGIKLFAVQSSRNGKRTILSDVITVYAKGGKAIVFTQTKRDAEEVSLAMNRTLGCEALHGDIAQFQREKTLAAFREGKFSILVATDVAARGLDIDNVDLVIHYDLPRDSETFVHRSGRTGRAGKAGNALVLYDLNDRRTLRQIENDVGSKFEYKSPPHAEEVLQSSSTQAVEVIKNVHPQLKDVFLPTAEKLLEEFGPSAFAAAIAHMSGFSQPPASRSLITHETGWMTLKYVSVRSGLNAPLAVRQVVGVVASLSQKAADNMGKVHLIDDHKGEGAVFDLPEDMAKDLLTKTPPQDDTIEAIRELPKLQETYDSMMGRGRSSYGRFDNGRPSFGRSPSTFGNRFGDRSSSGGRFSRDGRGGGGGGRFGGRSSSYGERSYGERSYGGSNERSFSGGNDRNFGGNFGGTCYKCGKSGHRASDCSIF